MMAQIQPTLYPILIVEDNDEDFEVIQWALKKLSITTPILRCLDGDEVLDLLYGRGEYSGSNKSPRPALILLDLSLTRTDGHEVLQRIKQDDNLKMIPVIVWTSSSDPKDIEVSFKQGANSYIIKSMNLERLLQTVEMLNNYWFGTAMLPSTVETEL